MKTLSGEASTLGDRIHRDGYAVVAKVLAPATLEELKREIASIDVAAAVKRKRSVYGVRNLLETCAAVRRTASLPAVRALATPVLGDSCFAARAVFFDKTPDANWSLGWHQDSVISVGERKDLPDFVAWSCKAGIWQVQPPAEVLAKMLAVRIHLDDCRRENGPLRVIPGSHRHGWLDDEIDDWKRKRTEVTCLANAGDAVPMRPLLLHASSAASSPSHRRVIHIEFANDPLPGGLEWNSKVGPA